MEKSLPTSKLSRSKVVGKAVLKIGIKKGKQLITRSNKEKNQEEIADIIFDALGELKGVSVKIAQQIALSMPFLPSAYVEKISKSFSAIPPINRALVRKIIKTELGDYTNNLFDDFDMQPFGSASLGQVHLATKNGEKLAIKVQYPGIKKSIETDISIINFALKRFAKGEDVQHLVDEIGDRLYEEVDYELEAKSCEFFRENLKSKDIVIPKVYPKLSTQRVLTTTFLDGLSFESYLKTNPSQKDRDRYAQIIIDSFFYSLYNLKRVHADPNPGNFLFLKDGRLGIIDFGCIKKIDDEFLKNYNSLHLALLVGLKDEEIISHYEKVGIVATDTKENMLKFYKEVVKPLDRLYIEPLIGNSYDFSKSKDFTKRSYEKILEVQKKQIKSVHRMSEDYLFLDRTLLGYYALFEKMGAKIDTTYIKSLIRGF